MGQKGRLEKENKFMAKKESGGGFGLLLAAAAAAAAGAYFVYGKNADKNRKKVKAWALKAKGEVLEKLEKSKLIDQQAYEKIVDAVRAKYEAVKGVDKSELEAMVKELRGHWKSIAKQVQGTPKKKTSSKKK